MPLRPAQQSSRRRPSRRRARRFPPPSFVPPAASTAAGRRPEMAIVELDVGNEAHWSRAVSLAEQKCGGIDILVNNAAVLVLAPLEQTSLADYERVVRVNQVGPFLGMRAVVPGMKRRGGGSIVNIGSTDGVFPGDQGLIASARASGRCAA